MTENYLVANALFGGILIGLAAAILLLFNGRIAGISGVLSGVIKKWDSSISWRLPFILGIPAGAVVLALIRGVGPTVELDISHWQLVLAGLLVGFGTRLGSGCTSGHGVCGLARLSGRSLVATGTFMVSAAVVVFVMRHVVGG